MFFEAIQKKIQIESPALIIAGHNLARQQFEFSVTQQYRKSGQTKTLAGDNYCALYEHEYGLEISTENISRCMDTISQCFNNLTKQANLLTMIYTGSKYLVEHSFEYKINNTTVTAKPDLIFLNRNNHLVIIDWKISNSNTSDYSKQLFLYGLALIRTKYWPNIKEEMIELLEVNLLKNEISRYPVNAKQVEEIEDFAYCSILEMEALIKDVNYENIDFNEFEVAGSPQTCLYCNFRKLCIKHFQTPAKSYNETWVQGRLW